MRYVSRAMGSAGYLRSLFGQVRNALVAATVTSVMLAGFSVHAHAAEPVRELVIGDFDDLRGWKSFEEPAGIAPEKANQKKSQITVSRDWASRGKTSVKIQGHAYVPDQTSAWPGIVLRGDAIPLRDWRDWKFMSVDIRVIQNDTPILVLVQWGQARWQRVSVYLTLNKGEHRLWINLPQHASGGKLQNLENIRSIELLLSQPKEERVIYFDNLRLTDTFTPTTTNKDILGMTDKQWQSVESILRTPAPSAPRTTYLESLRLDDAPQKQLGSHRLERISQTAQQRAAQAQASAQLAKDYPSTDHGLYIVPADERVHFESQPITHRWKRELTTTMGRGEVRSQQLVLMRPYGKKVDDISLTISDFENPETRALLPASIIDTQLVGYVNLVENQRLTGMVPGWYADPLLAWKGSISLDEKRQLQPLLLTVKVPRDATPGKYTGTITTTSKYSDGKAGFSVKIPVTINVVNHTFPVTPTLKTLVATGVYGEEEPEFYLDYRISPNNTKLGQIYLRGKHPAVDLKLVEEMISKGMTTFNLRQAFEGHLFPQGTSKTPEEVAREFIHSVDIRYSDSMWDSMVKNGVAEHAVIYGFDEVNLNSPSNREMIRAVFQAVKDKYGKYGVKTATTAYPMSIEALDLPVDIWVASLPLFDQKIAAEARRRGSEMWTYTIDWEIWRPLVWSRVLPWTTYQLRASGWLYYSFSDWANPMDSNLGDDPLTDWDPISWPAAGRYGTGGLVYRDAQNKLRGSLRLVNFREGMYDHDILVALRELAHKTDQEEIARQANSLIVQADSHLLLSFSQTYQGGQHGDKHTGLAESIGMMMDTWRQTALELLHENNH